MNEMIRNYFLVLFCFFIFISVTKTEVAFANIVNNLDAQSLGQKTLLFISPTSGTFIEGSSFDVPVYINTKNQSINTIDLYINYDPNKLAIIQPVGTKSIISLWLEAPNYSSSNGTIKLTGTIPGGINTESGLIANITFKAISSGKTSGKDITNFKSSSKRWFRNND